MKNIVEKFPLDKIHPMEDIKYINFMPNFKPLLFVKNTLLLILFPIVSSEGCQRMMSLGMEWKYYITNQVLGLWTQNRVCHFGGWAVVLDKR